MFVTVHRKSELIVPNQRLSTSQATLANLTQASPQEMIAFLPSWLHGLFTQQIGELKLNLQIH